MLSAKPLVDKIKVKYPHPIRPLDVDTKIHTIDTCYCVGGAFILWKKDYNTSNREDRFPSPNKLSLSLMSVNPKLDAFRALKYAISITRLNDKGYFNFAWYMLTRVLSYGTHRVGKS